MDRLAFQEWPAVLRRRWLITGAAGFGFLLVGLAVFFALGDRVLLMLSGMLTLCTLLHCVEYYCTVRSRRYQAIEATCVALGRTGIGRQRKVRLVLQDVYKRQIYTIVYRGEDHFADEIFHLTDEQKELAEDYAQNLSLFLGDGMFQSASGNVIPSLGLSLIHIWTIPPRALPALLSASMAWITVLLAHIRPVWAAT